MPATTIQFTSLTPDDLGFQSFDDIMNGLGGQDVDDVMNRLQELDAAKAASASSPDALNSFNRAAQAFGQMFQQPAGADTSATDPVPAGQDQPGLLDGIDFTAELEELLALDPEAAALREEAAAAIRLQLNPADASEQDNKIIAQATAAAEAAANRAGRVIQKSSSGAGLRHSGQEGSLHRQVLSDLATTVLDVNVRVMTRRQDITREQREKGIQNAAAFARAIETRNAQLAMALVEAHQADLNFMLESERLDLEGERLEIDRALIQENINLARDKFTETQRTNLKKEGWTDEQLDQQEEQMVWERAFREMQQTADFGLSQRNQTLQERIAGDNLTIEMRRATQDDRRIALEELKNKFGMSLEQATFEYMKEMGLAESVLERDRFYLDERRFGSDVEFRNAQLEMEREKFDALEARLEREFGMEINRFALEEAIRTGQLDLNIVNSQRKYDLDVKEQQERWLASAEARQLEEMLGLSTIEMNLLIAEGKIDAETERRALERWMFQEGLDWDKKRFDIQLAAARKKKKGGCLKKMVGAVVGAGVGFITGGPAGALVGAASSILSDMGQPEALDQILNYSQSKSNWEAGKSTSWTPSITRNNPESLDLGTL